MKEDMYLSNLSTVALHAAKVPTNVFSSTLICNLTLDYNRNNLKCKQSNEIFIILLQILGATHMMAFQLRKGVYVSPYR